MAETKIKRLDCSRNPAVIGWCDWRASFGIRYELYSSLQDDGYTHILIDNGVNGRWLTPMDGWLHRGVRCLEYDTTRMVYLRKWDHDQDYRRARADQVAASVPFVDGVDFSEPVLIFERL